MAEEKSPLTLARDDLVERISVAGWKEAIDEKVPSIRYSFRFSLVALSCACLYYLYKGIKARIVDQYDTQVFDFFTESIPFSNVTICAQVYFNETFIRENMTIPERVLAKFTNSSDPNKHSLDEFYRQLTLFLSIISRPRQFDPKFLIYFAQVLKVNPQLYDFAAFVPAAIPKCGDMLKRCWFNGVEFDCCAHAVQSFDDDGVCFLVPLNYDSDNAVPSPRTTKQIRDGPPGGLTIEASLPVQDFPWLEDDAQNGFRIIVHSMAYSGRTSPQTAPHGAITFIKVKPEKRILAEDCTPHGHLSFEPEDLLYGYYDPEGFNCQINRMMNAARISTSCSLVFQMNRPNRTTSCKPFETYFIFSSFSEENLAAKFSGAQSGAWEKISVSELVRKSEEVWRLSINEGAECPNHCIYWQYGSTASFVYLENDSPEKTQKSMYSRIHVYYGELVYHQHEESKQLTAYLAFYDFGNIVGLYWGMSVVSFIHVFVYVPRYLYVLYRGPKTETEVGQESNDRIVKLRNVKRRGQNQVFRGVRNVRVRPIEETSM